MDKCDFHKVSYLVKQLGAELNAGLGQVDFEGVSVDEILEFIGDVGVVFSFLAITMKLFSNKETAMEVLSKAPTTAVPIEADRNVIDFFKK